MAWHHTFALNLSSESTKREDGIIKVKNQGIQLGTLAQRGRVHDDSCTVGCRRSLKDGNEVVFVCW